MSSSEAAAKFGENSGHKRCVVLLSAGLDSTVNLYAARAKMEVVLAITFDYGQRAASREIECAQNIANVLKIPHRTLAVPFIKEFGRSSLTTTSVGLPLGEKVKIDDLKQSQETAKSVWVPNRNGIFLNIAAGFAEALDAEYVIPGFNKEEAATFPDNSQDFLEEITKSFAFSTGNHVKALCFTTQSSKTEIVSLGKNLGVDFSRVWPCYQNFQKWCGQCESCQRARRALVENGISCQDFFEQA